MTLEEFTRTSEADTDEQFPDGGDMTPNEEETVRWLDGMGGEEAEHDEADALLLALVHPRVRASYRRLVDRAWRNAKEKP